MDEFCFRRKRIEKRRFDYARNSYRDELSNFLPCSCSRALPSLLLMLCLISLMNLTITHMVSFHERNALCLDTLVTAHIIIMVIVSHVGPAFLLEGLLLTLSLDT
jgi:ABC-type dipeptide/oligopeptide/nickel transport system permease subunit